MARGMASDLEKSGYKEGCPIATTALETAAQSDVLGAATRNAFQKWENEIKRGLQRFGTTADEVDRSRTTVLSHSRARCCWHAPTIASNRCTVPSMH